MSNEITDLDWLARNVHKWPCGHQGWCYVTTHASGAKGVAINKLLHPEAAKVTMDEWLARRAELQNKPSFDDHPDAKCFVQDDAGHWYKNVITDEVYPRSHFWWMDFDGYQHNGFTLICKGELLGDWRDTLERRPEEFKPFISIEDNQEKAMKQDNGWHERGELPPVGTNCLYQVSGKLGYEVEITAHAKLGICFVEIGKSGENYVSKNAERHRFLPIRTERDELIEVLKNTHAGNLTNLDMLASAILAAGFSLGAK